MKQLYSSGDTSRISGATLRMLQHWAECGIIVPEIDGHRRCYSRDQVILVAFTMELRAKKFTIRQAISLIRSQSEQIVELSDADIEAFLVVSGKQSMIAGAGQPDVIRWMCSRKSSCVVVPIPRAAEIFRAGRRPPVVERAHYVAPPLSRGASALMGAQI